MDIYEMCGNEFCYHFIEDNRDYDYETSNIAPHLHLDDGEKEHDHDAIPSGNCHTLNWWRMAWPQLFTGYPDGKIGPNSRFFTG